MPALTTPRTTATATVDADQYLADLEAKTSTVEQAAVDHRDVYRRLILAMAERPLTAGERADLDVAVAGVNMSPALIRRDVDHVRQRNAAVAAGGDLNAASAAFAAAADAHARMELEHVRLKAELDAKLTAARREAIAANQRVTDAREARQRAGQLEADRRDLFPGYVPEPVPTVRVHLLPYRDPIVSAYQMTVRELEDAAKTGTLRMRGQPPEPMTLAEANDRLAQVKRDHAAEMDRLTKAAAEAAKTGLRVITVGDPACFQMGNVEPVPIRGQTADEVAALAARMRA